LQVPNKAAFALTAGTAKGEITNDLGLRALENDDRRSLTGQIRRGGPAIVLQTSGGDITIQSKSVTSDTESDDAEETRSSPDFGG
jgi:hypothetical protein